MALPKELKREEIMLSKRFSIELIHLDNGQKIVPHDQLMGFVEFLTTIKDPKKVKELQDYLTNLIA